MTENLFDMALECFQPDVKEDRKCFLAQREKGSHGCMGPVDMTTVVSKDFSFFELFRIIVENFETAKMNC